MEIIPAIDLIDGKCVRLTGGDYAQKTVYNENPLDVARQFEAAGMNRLHLVDLDGARAGHVVNLAVLEGIASGTGLKVDFGGGIKTSSDLTSVLSAGATWATVGTIAVKDPFVLRSWISAYGPDRFVLGADVRGEKVAVSGWLEDTEMNLFDLLQEYVDKGVTQAFCTDISKDGKLQGPSVELYRRIIAAFPSLYLIASGGVSRMEDLHQLLDAGCSAAIIGKAIYEGRITLAELRDFSDKSNKDN
jgi:phosphoribosylformimino-5-aminoimidazole carboxamide ribotide isomerase